MKNHPRVEEPCGDRRQQALRKRDMGPGAAAAEVARGGDGLCAGGCVTSDK